MRRNLPGLAALLFLAIAPGAGAALRPATVTPPYAAGEQSISFLAAGVSIRVEEPGPAELAERLTSAGAPADALPADRFLVLTVTLGGIGAGAGTRLDLAGAVLATGNGRLRPLRADSFQRQGRPLAWARELLGLRSSASRDENGSVLLVFRRPGAGPAALEGMELRIGDETRELRFPFESEK